MIIYFAPGGRLGNQIFQAAALMDRIKPGERLVFAKMAHFLEIFEWHYRIRNLENSLLYKILDQIVFRYFLLPATRKLRLFSLISEAVDRVTPVMTRGAFPWIRIADGYFQSESFFRPAIREVLRIKPQFRQAAERFLAPDGSDRPRVCVHIRRQDYLSFNGQTDRPVVLPLTYYHRALQELKERVPNAVYVFVSDDPAFVESTFAHVVPRRISNESAAVDLAIMTKCQHMIMANSTLSWWGAYLREKPGIAIAPEYWMGWSTRTWDPPGIRPSFAEILPVDQWEPKT